MNMCAARRGWVIAAGLMVGGLAIHSGVWGQASQPGVKVTIVSPGEGPVNIFINETLPMRAKVENAGGAGKDNGRAVYNFDGDGGVPVNYTIAWTASMGSFTESYSPVTTFMNISDINGGPDKLLLWAAAVPMNATPAREARPATRPAATMPAAGGGPAKAPLPGPGSLFLPDTLKAELAQADAAEDRDGRVQRLRALVAQRPNDPWNIVADFNIGTLLGQNPDPEHHQAARPEESLAVFEKIVERYDHAVYYKAHPVGETCSPELMVPRAAILAASIYTGYLHEPEKAQALLTVAMVDLNWTFHKRTDDWANAPAPAPMPAGFDGPMEEAKRQSRVAAWEKEKGMALAGQAIGPYEKELAEAAVRQWGLSFGPQAPKDVVVTMQGISARFPKSPLATAAQEHINRAEAAMRPKAADGEAK